MVGFTSLIKVAIILMGFVYEALKYFREYLMLKHASCAGKLESQNLLNPSNTAGTTSSTRENTHPGNCGASLC